METCLAIKYVFSMIHRYRQMDTWLNELSELDLNPFRIIN